jgi:iron complex outermembrane receptor protein
MTDRLFLTGGLRVSHDEYYDAYSNLGVVLGGPGHIDYDLIKKTMVTPRAVIRYKPTENSSVYASYTQGYKSALRDISSESNRYISPEKISAYEVGYKIAEPSFSANLSAYYYDYKNLQVETFVGATAVTSNAANSRIYGVEGDFRYAFNRNFEVSAAAAYTDAKYKFFKAAPVFNQCLDPSCGLGTFPSAQMDLHDSPMQFAPKFSGNIGAQYMTNLAGGAFTLYGNISYTAKEYFDNAAQFANKAHEDLTLHAQWVDPNGHYTFAVFGENLTNKRYLTQIQPNAVAVLTTWSAPRTFGASIAAKF